MAGTRPLRIGVVGLGFGADVHVPAFRLLPGVEVIALLGKSPQKVADAERRSNISATTSSERFFAHELDAVSVAVPPGEVEAVVNLCLDHNLAIFCEKPLGPDIATAKRLVGRSLGVTTALDFEFAELEAFTALRALVHAGQIGAVRHIEISWLNESWAHRGSVWSWKTDSRRHGGVLNLLGTHVLYLVELLVGPISGVSARLDSRATDQLIPSPGFFAAEDLVHATLEHDCGVVTSMTIGNANPGLASHRWTVVGTQGSAVLENATRDYIDGFTLATHKSGGKVLLEKSETRGAGDGRLQPVTRLAARFVEAIRTGAQCVPGFSHGARVQFLVDAIRLAAREKRHIEIRGGS
jgi:predicted dehydrogenase